MHSFLLFTLLLFSVSFQPTAFQNNPENCLSLEEKKLFDLINDYRKTKKLKPIAFSAKLTKVAQAHVHDLMENYVADTREGCNPHSWSAKGNWAGCCYTPDHKQAKCMWAKPKEIADYPTFGYEIAYYSSDDATAQEGLDGWKKSAGHNPLLINSGMWAKVQWKAMGVALYKNYGVVWFGETDDPSTVAVCP